MASVLIILGYPVLEGQPTQLQITAPDLQGLEVIMACTPCVIRKFAAIPDIATCTMQEYTMDADPPPPPEVLNALPTGSLVLRFTAMACAQDWYNEKKAKLGLHVAYLFDDTQTWVIGNPTAS
jgi:hypothetical protein